MSRKYADKPLRYKIAHQQRRILKLNREAESCYKRGKNILAVKALNSAYHHERILDALLMEYGYENK